MKGDYFSREPPDKGRYGMFLIDDRVKQEALNFATLMNILKITEQKLDPVFEKFSQGVDVAVPMTDKDVFMEYSVFFDIPDLKRMKRIYAFSRRKFSQLKPDDEIIKRGSIEYPPLLNATQQAPRFLYVRGRIELLQERRTVSLIGARQASDEAKLNTKRVAQTLGRNGITVVSGLAKGIDVTAHRSALDKNHNTIAVIGTNLNQYYPPENKEVQLEIEKRGLVVSQFSPATKTERWFFPLRNGVMSGLSLATVIMEAGENSGALKQGRQVLIPSKALEMSTITWPKKYVDKGAQTVATPKEILQRLADNNILNKDIGKEEQLDVSSIEK
mgnify:FL=1